MKAEGTISATGKSYVPTEAYIFVNLAQVEIQGMESFSAIANNPEGEAADVNGSQKDVSGSGNLHIFPSTTEIADPHSNLLFLTK